MLSIQQLSKQYGTINHEINVLEDVTTSISAGEFVMIMGESGSGKSTFLNCISTLDKPTSGKVFYQEKNILVANMEQVQQYRLYDFGFIFQENHMIDTLTMIENIMIAHVQLNKKAKDSAFELMNQLGISHIANKYPHQISGGERQRCAIARALINKPGILFADEPTASLNPQVASEIMEILKDLNQKGQTIIMVTHSVKMAAYGKRLLLLSGGNFSVDADLSKVDEQQKQETIVSLAMDIL